jgi:hypothetical protein
LNGRGIELGDGASELRGRVEVLEQGGHIHLRSLGSDSKRIGPKPAGVLFLNCRSP